MQSCDFLVILQCKRILIGMCWGSLKMIYWWLREKIIYDKLHFLPWVDWVIPGSDLKSSWPRFNDKSIRKKMYRSIPSASGELLQYFLEVSRLLDKTVHIRCGPLMMYIGPNLDFIFRGAARFNFFRSCDFWLWVWKIFFWLVLRICFPILHLFLSAWTTAIHSHAWVDFYWIFFK